MTPPTPHRALSTTARTVVCACVLYYLYWLLIIRRRRRVGFFVPNISIYGEYVRKIFEATSVQNVMEELKESGALQTLETQHASACQPAAGQRLGYPMAIRRNVHDTPSR